MSTHHRSHATAATLSLLLAGAVVACGGSHAESKPPVAASTPSVAPGGASAAASSAGQSAHPSGPSGAGGSGEATSPAGAGQDDQDDAELVVSRDVVARCPKLRAVRQHVAEFDPDMVWLAVLESLGECMGQGGPMADQTIGVSGDEEHRHVVREVLGSRGVAPTRIIATPVAGAAECQGGADCSKRVEITIAPTSP